MKFTEALKIKRQIENLVHPVFDEKKEDGVMVVVANVYHMDYDYAKYTEHLSLSQLANCDDFIVWYYSTNYEYTKPFMPELNNLLRKYVGVIIAQESNINFSFYLNTERIYNAPCPKKPYGKNPMTSIIEGGFSVNFKVNKRIRIKKEESQND